jgi:hypothetical protein
MRTGASPSAAPSAINRALGVPEYPATDDHVRPLIAPPRCAAGHITSEQEQIRANLTVMTTASRNFGRWATAANAGAVLQLGAGGQLADAGGGGGDFVHRRGDSVVYRNAQEFALD